MLNFNHIYLYFNMNLFFWILWSFIRIYRCFKVHISNPINPVSGQLAVDWLVDRILARSIVRSTDVHKKCAQPIALGPINQAIDWLDQPNSRVGPGRPSDRPIGFCLGDGRPGGRPLIPMVIFITVGRSTDGEPTGLLGVVLSPNSYNLKPYIKGFSWPVLHMI